MYQVKNLAPGARYFSWSGGNVTVQADGVSEPLNLTADDIKSIEEHPDLEVERASRLTDASGGGSDGEGDDVPLSRMNKAQLLEAAEGAGLATVDRDGEQIAVNEATNGEIRAALEAKRAG